MPLMLSKIITLACNTCTELQLHSALHTLYPLHTLHAHNAKEKDKNSLPALFCRGLLLVTLFYCDSEDIFPITL